MGAAAALPAVATTATTTALGTGLTAGSILGTGAASTGLLGSLGLNALGGMTSVLPAAAAAGPSLALPALATKGLTAAASPGIFANPAAAGFLGKSFTPLASQAAGASKLASTVAPNVVGQNQVLAEFSRQGLGQGFKQVGPNLAGPADPASLTSKFGLDSMGGNVGLKGPQITPETPLSQGPLAFRQTLPSGIDPKANALSNLGNLAKNPSMQGVKDYAEEHPYATSAAVGLGVNALMGGKPKTPAEQDKGMIRPYEFTRTQRPEAYAVSPLEDTSERMYFDSKFTPLEPYSATSSKAKEIEKIAEGGIAKAYAIGGPVEMMAAQNAVGANTGYPMAGINTAMYSNPMVQRPEAVNVISPSGDAGVTAYSGEPKFARGGLSDLGDYSDGGRLLKGPGDGVSDSIPAVIGKRQPARLADGEFVIPARIVSELGNGSTEAGARKLYAMMERVQATRKKSIGKKKVAVNSKADKHLPA
jgi:hypothetical protein